MEHPSGADLAASIIVSHRNGARQHAFHKGVPTTSCRGNSKNKALTVTVTVAWHSVSHSVIRSVSHNVSHSNRTLAC